VLTVYGAIRKTGDNLGGQTVIFPKNKNSVIYKRVGSEILLMFRFPTQPCWKLKIVSPIDYVIVGIQPMGRKRFLNTPRMMG
jgi:hypothetical protein